MMIEYQAQTPGKKLDILTDMRLLPSQAKFKVQLDAWAAAALRELEEEQKAAEKG
jgi:intracellular multiplication protein IcmJ